MNNINILSERPFIATMVSSFTEEELNNLRSMEINEQSKTGYDPASAQVNNFRTSKSIFPKAGEYLHVSEKIIENINTAFNRHYTTKSMETIEFTRYDQGEYFREHNDFHNQDPHHILKDRDRVATAILYINDDFEGGYTNFPALNIRIKPQKGMILLFEYPPSEDLSINLLNLHEGEEIIKGTKIIATQWLLDEDKKQQPLITDKVNTKILSQKPFIAVFDSLLSEEVLNYLNSIPIEHNALEEHEHRHAFVLYTGREEIKNNFLFLTDMFIKRIEEELGIKYTVRDIEPAQIARYTKGGFFSSHTDFMNQDPDPNRRYTERDRIATAILYINDDYTGGTTFFEKLNLHVKGKKGQILYYEYNPLKTPLEINMKTLHAGSLIEEGEKRIVVQLFLEKNYE